MGGKSSIEISLLRGFILEVRGRGRERSVIDTTRRMLIGRQRCIMVIHGDGPMGADNPRESSVTSNELEMATTTADVGWGDQRETHIRDGNDT